MALAEHFIETSLGRTRYLDGGGGEPLFMLHGMGLSNSANTFDPVFAHLTPHVRVIAPDLLGFGKGTRSVEAGPTFDLMLEHLRELMDSLGIERAAFAGHSMGGWTAAHLAYQSPNRVAKLAMLNAAGLNVQIAAGIGGMSSVPSVEALAKRIRGEFRDPAKATDALVNQIATTQHAMLSEPNALASLNPLLHIMQTPSLRARTMLHRRLPRLRLPALVLWGSGDQIDPYPTWTEEYERLGGDMSRSTKPWIIPGAKHVRLETGHYSHWEMPDKVAELVVGFLAGK